MTTTTRPLPEAEEGRAEIKRRAETHQIVVCNCPVCHLAGAERLLVAFASILGSDPHGLPHDPKIRLKMERLEGVCTRGPNITLDGARYGMFELANARAFVQSLRPPAPRRKTHRRRTKTRRGELVPV